MNERKGRVLEALLETVEFAVLSYAMSGAAFALRRHPLWILFMVVEIRLLQKYWAALGRCLTARWARWTLAALGVAAGAGGARPAGVRGPSLRPKNMRVHENRSELWNCLN